jgi:hypothetical protein
VEKKKKKLGQGGWDFRPSKKRPQRAHPQLVHWWVLIHSSHLLFILDGALVGAGSLWSIFLPLCYKLWMSYNLDYGSTFSGSAKIILFLKCQNK